MNFATIAYLQRASKLSIVVYIILDIENSVMRVFAERVQVKGKNLFHK